MTRRQCIFPPELESVKRTCPPCGGTGTVPCPLSGEDVACAACVGSGQVPEADWEFSRFLAGSADLTEFLSRLRDQCAGLEEIERRLRLGGQGADADLYGVERGTCLAIGRALEQVLHRDRPRPTPPAHRLTAIVA